MPTRIRPRGYLTEDCEYLFGRALQLRWRVPGNKAVEPYLSAAFRQHLLAFNVRRAMRINGETQLEVASRIGVNPETLRRRLRGEVFIGWDDASVLALALPGHLILPSSRLLLPNPF